MLFVAIVLISLLLQCAAAYNALRLIALTRHTRAWLLLSAGLVTMAARRFITLIALFSSPTTHHLTDYYYEVIGVFGSGMMLFGVIAIRPLFQMIKAAEEEQRALAESLRDVLVSTKTLKGTLSICAACKKIRDDNGDWQAIEAYISQYTDTKFSHGICPDCIRKLYPEKSERILGAIRDKESQ